MFSGIIGKPFVSPSASENGGVIYKGLYKYAESRSNSRTESKGEFLLCASFEGLAVQCQTITEHHETSEEYLC